MVEQQLLTSWWTGRRKRDRERTRTRTREIIPALADYILFPLTFYQPPAHGMLLFTLRSGLPHFLNPLWKLPHSLLIS
jgi:hypothetical protein